jgi:hypothetical protein
LPKIHVLRSLDDTLQRQYDFGETTCAVRGNYAAGYRIGTNLTLLSPHAARCFPGDESVSAAHRVLIWTAGCPPAQQAPGIAPDA